MSGKVRGVLIDISPLRESAAFRRIFCARLISIIGIGLLMVSVPIQMYDLTGSSAQVGAATAVTGVTTFVGMLVGGVLADRFDRKKLILLGRTGAALSFAGLALNAFGVFGTTSVVALYVLAGVDGLIGSLSTSALMAAVPTLIPRDKLVAVGALSSLTVRVGTAISPAIAGLIIAAAGVEWAYTIAAILATLTVLILLGLPSMPPTAATLGAESESSSGEAQVNAADAAHSDSPQSLIEFLTSQRVVLGVMIVGVLAMLGAGLVALLPALVAERFGGDARATGLLYAAVACGAMLGALTSGWLAGVRRPGVVLLGALAGAALVQVLFGFAPVAWLAIVLLCIVGYLEATQEVLRYSLIQHHTPGPLLGRVNGIWMAQEVGGVTIGALVAGVFGTIWTASDAIVYYGLALLVLSIIAAFALRAVVAVRNDRPVESTLS
ncbi:siderophore export protein [Gordonia sp. 852002-50816_SCH5313054-c]|uniref:enterobactin transporter EntS n=1 Tax=unclassified Gordonia (in: high G+C Gram-positive bacteria) TaxID=2657482 RepID=UPI0007EA39EB|nr:MULTISPECIES: enterobactin transporter EntS [unclassified Gordonia (in: high G+C Gram-positive bacteria)]OBC03572.1 siderophore export protein [Gordonia sp. 852002-50816_SCH5313054-a]OBC19084.1 siderophore export protein [Gordonia sp. 852002-50816_SCH5313054-c]